ncbi:hypothetical protein ASD24_29545 [Paenibacillus sp. Root52]|uniref:hypothetical protein n=1 Tax=Paenibacillus sp. Root52 TaxID=1736552 RepID=UPI0006FE714B|nr:hypothetical protein [Paenibacillus sp. Root52]KQY83754.1 hypothetical protein ASD24_29545 [Paenibacillus sp. Root52]
MSERVYELLNNAELIVSEEVLGLRLSSNQVITPIGADEALDEALKLIDHLQQTVTQRDRTIELLTKPILSNSAIASGDTVTPIYPKQPFDRPDLACLDKELIKKYAVVLIAAQNLSKFIYPDGTPSDGFMFRSIAANMKTLIDMTDWKFIEDLMGDQGGERNIEGN